MDEGIADPAASGRRSTSGRPSASARRLPPFHPVLLAAWPVLFLLAENAGEADPAEAVLPIAISVGVTIAVVAVVRLLGASVERAALVGSIGAIVVLLFGHVADALAPLGQSEGRILVAWLVLGGAAVLLALRFPRGVATASRTLNALSAVLVASSVISLVVADVRPGGAPATAASPSATPSSDRPRPSPTPGAADRDIYFIVVEDYGSPRSIAQYLGVRDDGFFDWLAASGFTVLRDTTSNYGRTPLSMASMLNMTYLDEVAAAEGPDSEQYRPINDLVSGSALARFLKDRGYTIAQLGSQYYLTARSSLADVNPQFDRTSDFLGVLYETTIFPAIATRLGFQDAFTQRRTNYEAFQWQLATFPSLRDLPGPKLVITHLFLPHHPWVVDEDGGYVSAAADRRRSPLEQREAQWRTVDRSVRAMLEPLLSGPEETRPIIVLTTDEGPNPDGMPVVKGDIAWSQATDAELDQKFSIFAAYYLPESDAPGPRPSMSSVNAWRFVLDRYFDAGFGLLPDRSFIHQDKSHPYVLTDITDRLPSR
jgi:hypothetical protein